MKTYLGLETRRNVSRVPAPAPAPVPPAAAAVLVM